MSSCVVASSSKEYAGSEGLLREAGRERPQVVRGEEAHSHAAEAPPAEVARAPGVLVHLPREVVVEHDLREADEARALCEADVAAQRIGTGGHEQRHLAAGEVLEGARALHRSTLRVEHCAA